MLLVALQVLQGVVAIHVDDIKLAVECRVVLFAEEIVLEPIDADSINSLAREILSK